MKTIFVLGIALLSITFSNAAEDDCPVCLKVLTDVIAKIPTDKKADQPVIDKLVRSHCKELLGKENRFCNYIGALPESPTSMMNEVSKPLSWSMPPAKICEKLKLKAAQICDLKFDKGIDWKTVDLKKLKVKDLKKILENWGEHCKGCTEKTEFVTKINELKPKFVKEEL